MAITVRRCAVLLLAVLMACDANSFDATQVPAVTVVLSQSGPPQISFQPNGAQLVRVYRGTVAGDGYSSSLVWSIAANSANSLTSVVTYGVTPSTGTVDVPAQSLSAGESYTVQVTRADPKGSGDGFTNTRNRYVGTKTFTALGMAAMVCSEPKDCE